MKHWYVCFLFLFNCHVVSIFAQSLPKAGLLPSGSLAAELDSSRLGNALYRTYNLLELNTYVEEFAPVMYKKNSLVFVKKLAPDITATRGGEKERFTVVEAKANSVKDSVYYKSTTAFPASINTAAHNGPVCFNGTKDHMYFTRSETNSTGKLKSKIYEASWNGHSWKHVHLLEAVNDSSSSMHPYLSPDGNSLFFASDRPGGFGGLDLYVSHKGNQGWGKPENLGTYINTPGNELFPSMDETGRLYFASNGHAGFGGLDLFAASLEGKKYSHVTNLLPPMNSEEDDFGITFRDDRKGGYFSSNRKKGKGAGDIYGFSQWGTPQQMAGRIMHSLRSGDGAPGICMILYTDQGFPLQTTCTDSAGNFHFDYLPPGRHFSIEAEPENHQIVTGTRLFLVDSRGKPVSVTVINEKGKYVFTALATDLSAMSPVAEEDTEMHGQSLSGSFLYGANKTPMSNKTVRLLNANNEVVQTAKTNYFGTVLFTNIPPGADYSVALSIDDPKIETEKVYFISRTGEPVDESNKKLGFRYSLLAKDQAKIKNLVIDDTQLKVNIKGILYKDAKGSVPIVHIAVDLLNKSGEITQTCLTDDHGLFKFSHKFNKELYTVSVKDTSQKEIYVADENGTILDKMKIKDGKFVFELLPYFNTKLSELAVEDPWIDLLEGNANRKESLVIIESIYYKYQDWSVTPEAEVILNKVIDVMKNNLELKVELSSHTDSRGSDVFNMQLSQKRADSGVKYMVSKGIDQKRISGKGYGESRLLNRCGNGITCTEEEHQVNRRAEFKVMWLK